MTVDYNFLKENDLILYEIISGSRLYGTNKPTSDFDKRYVYILPNEYIFGMRGNYIEQVNDKTNDVVGYEIGRFLELVSVQNPNILELLFADSDDCIIYKHPMFDDILQYKDKFLSKVCRDSFGGYAIAQIKKARGLNKKIVNPVEKERKNVLDFCYAIVGYKSVPLKNFLENSGYQQQYCGLVAIDHARDTYALFYDNTYKRHLGYRGIMNEELTSNDIRLSSVEKGEEPVITILYNKDGYTKYCKDYKEYWEWVEKRNDDRYQTNQEHGKGYDCYLEEETEFLTKNGWKKYDQISDNDLLGTVNPKTLELEWEKHYSRFDDVYSGKIYTYENRYTKFSVTDNHNLFLGETSRRRETGFTTKLNGDFKFQTVGDYFNKRKSHKHVLISLNNNQSDYDISDDMLSLIGMYISEGSLIKNENKKIKGISLSQVKNGDFMKLIDKIKNSFNVHHYEFKRNGRIENTFNIYDKELSNIFEIECSEYSSNKKLPSYFMSLSSRQVDILLHSLMSGDGHKHTKGHMVYYSSSILLIDELHLLLTLHGYNTQKYIYENGCYQLFISKKKRLSQCINKMTTRPFSWKINDVVDKRIVCFSVKNSILITKNNEKIAFQGNSKNMMHCIRLTRMAIEIAEQKKVIVRRPDAEELLRIRNGDAEYGDLLNESETSIKLLDELYERSDLPEKIDPKFVNDILLNFRKKYYKL